MIEITIPKLGLTMESAILVRWEVRSGDEVREGDVVLVIETDKVTSEVRAPGDGFVHPIVVEGTHCKVEEVVGYIAESRQEYERILRESPHAEIGRAEMVETVGVSAASGRPTQTVSVPRERRPGDRIKASPLARSMAVIHNVDLAAINGTGPGGRIVRADILRAIEVIKAPEEKLPAIALDHGSKASAAKDILESIPIKGVRRAIFENMHRSLSESAQLTLHTDACAEALIGLRVRLDRDGQKISYNALLVKILAMALRLHPGINATVERDSIRVWRQIHIGVAIEATDALIVPVVRNPDLKTIREIDCEINELIDKANSNRLSPDDLANGTFTLTNLGFAGIDYFTPIIRPPESAILGVGRILRRPVVRGDRVRPEAQIGLSLTFDHRIVDGAPAARFLKTVTEMIEEPMLMIG